MNNTKLSYEFPAEALPSYLAELLGSGCCPALLSGSCYRKGGNLHFVCDTAGTRPLVDMIRVEDGTLLSGFSVFLRALVKICEAALIAEDSLIDMAYLSFAPEDIYFDADNGNAKLLLRPGGMCFADAAEALCNFAAENCRSANAEIVRERLGAENAAGRLDPLRLLRILTVWDFELKSGGV